MRLFVFAIFLSAASAVEVPYLQSVGGDALPNSYVIQLKDGVDVDLFSHILQSQVAVDIKYVYTKALNGLAIETMDLPSVRTFDEIKVVEDNIRVRKVVEWGMDRIDQRNLPLDGLMLLHADGLGANIYVVDSGIRYTHEQFGGRASYFWDYNPSNGGNDCDGHGTHCSGTAAGNTVGIAPKALLFSVRVLDCQGSGYISDIVAGLNEIITNGADPTKSVCSLSVGSGPNNAFDDAVRNTILAGYTVSVAAGNSNGNACFESPSRVDECITVAATDSTDTRASFSNFGTCVDLFAPGVNVRSSTQVCDTCYATWSGTSMACPHVTGIAAIHLADGHCTDNTSCKTEILAEATAGVVTDPSNSPNLLAYCD